MDSIFIGIIIASVLIIIISILRFIFSGKLLGFLIKTVIVFGLLFMGVSYLLNHFNVNPSEAAVLVNTLSKVKGYVENVDYNAENKAVTLTDDGLTFTIRKDTESDKYLITGEIDKGNTEAISNAFSILEVSDDLLNISETIEKTQESLQNGDDLVLIGTDAINNFAELAEQYVQNPNAFLADIEKFTSVNGEGASFNIGDMQFTVDGETIVFHN